ncbi:NtaA/DmoA family FMN-dependent monooxygenase [Nocardia sp. NBC_00565]|uniref:NtaA/DmoA family FMN-dependent monooxygenase n=1 Tax=Nocardia sp. NBC_00565 TaxID=2975993 RepID=UPI002E7FB6B2|nr:NtaA/DmoA family FMN-dependent monooxygenase [Nocardia sp. NBC_00565]WUC06508.1 NtaA/DmoA family FMN-dependent monooxygenase [Nocardia sp. NBC_00565]
MARSLHFFVNVGSAGYHPAAWLEPELPADAFIRLEHYQRVAAIAERGALDALLFPDIPVQQPSIARAPAATLDPILLTSALAVSTDRIGLIPTATTSLNLPYNLARRILSLDHISGGRAGWNVVTTFEPNAARNFGITELPERDERYRRAAEYVELTEKLWDSWEADVIIGDQQAGRFADPDRVHATDHRGEFYSVAGPLNVTRSPQGRPVLVQAGSSPQGRAFAAAHAEAIYTTQLSLPGARKFSAEIRSAAAISGRDPGVVRILPGLVPVIGATEAEARNRFDELQGRLHPDSAPVRSLVRWLGYPDVELDLDAPLPQRLTRLPEGRIGPQGFFESVTRYAIETGHTVRQLLTEFLGGHRVVIGTPETVADHIELWFRDGGIDGFTIIPAVLPAYLTDFVDQVVPELRRRGLFRHEYQSTTLRAHLGLPEPVNSFARQTVSASRK